MHAVFEPASRFWTMQLVETGLFTGAAIVLIGFAAWWTDRRAAWRGAAQPRPEIVAVSH